MAAKRGEIKGVKKGEIISVYLILALGGVAIAQVITMNVASHARIQRPFTA